MLSVLMAAWLLSSVQTPQDPSVEIRRGDRVEIRGLSGSVEVRGWERPALTVVGEGADADVSVRREGTTVVVSPGERKGAERAVRLVLRVAAWAPLEIQGRTLDVSVEAMSSDVTVRTVEGRVSAVGTAGALALSTVEGRVEVRDARGRVSARSRGDEVVLVGVEGAVQVSSGSGDLRLEDVRATTLEAETLDGDLYFRGPLVPGGSYRFSVHDGDADLVVPEGTGARVRVATFDGEFTSDFPVTLRRYGGGGMFDFTLGDGSASLEVQVFDGEIRLRSGGR